MARPEITLQEWLDTDVNQKIRFITNEIDQNNIHGVLNFYPDKPMDKVNVVFKKNSMGGEIYGQLRFNTEQGSFCYNISLTLVEYNKLRAKYRCFNRKKNETNLLKKQYKISKQTVYHIRSLKNRWNLSREENVIENLINSYVNEEEIKKTKVQLNTKLIKFNTLHQEIDKLNKDVYELNNQNECLREKIKKMEELLASAYLKSDHYKDLLNENNIDISISKIDDEKIKNKIIEIKEILKESI